GHCALLVGTHALIEDDVEIANLGLAGVDEQHRFGGRQRELVRPKGQGRPHFLAMTATPIPRTLALALYGEVAVSVRDELPPGRTPVVAGGQPRRATARLRAGARAGSGWTPGLRDLPAGRGVGGNGAAIGDGRV